MSQETFCERFSRLTDDANLSIAEVARIMGVREGAVYKIRRGDSQTIRFMGALRLAKRLGVTPYYLAGEAEPSASSIERVSHDPPLDHEMLSPRVNRDAIAFRLREAAAETEESSPIPRPIEAQVQDLQRAAVLSVEREQVLLSLLDLLESAEELPQTFRERLRTMRGAA